MNTNDVVVRFAVALGLCLRALRAQYVSIDRDGPTKPLVARTTHGDRLRSGPLEGFGVFMLHGKGCRVELDSGELVDFDWNWDGAVAFDAWRLRKFARSIGCEEVSEDDLRGACKDLVAAGLLTDNGDGWFSLRS